MLPNSNSKTDLRARQSQHRRQKSTPSAPESAQISSLPTVAQRRAAANHRRGMSFGHGSGQHETVRSTNTNNTGYHHMVQHNVLRETQPQQQTQARLGSHSQFTNQQPFHQLSSNSNNGNSYLVSPHGTPSIEGFDGSSNLANDTMTFEGLTQMGLIPGSFGGEMTPDHGFDQLLRSNSLSSTNSFMSCAESPPNTGWVPENDPFGSRRSPRRVSNGIMDQYTKFEALSMESGPMTPPNAMNSIDDYLPLTPTDTPHDRMTKLEARPGRFSAGYDESMEETVRPNRKRTSEGQFQSAFEVMRAQSEQNSLMPGTPSTGSFPDPRIGGMGQSVQQSPHISDASFNEDDYLKFELSFDSQHDADPAMHRPSSSYQGSMPSTPQNANFPGTLDLSQSDAHSRALTSPYAAASMLSQSSSHHSSPRRSSPHRRTDSIASMQSAASIAGINIEETKTETGVTIDDIAQYIEGPDLQDGRWTCNFEDCGKRFGRKENIKSHVQTHLNDRQYKCPHCQKCFVRQHDLKRHAKIHTGIKPYPCECGNSFARHDALTRHRQRGMCVGAFDGVVRKVVKRGRPKKNRPEMEERLEKSARQRKKNMSVSSVSSSTYTDHSSAVTSPNQDMTMVDNMMGIVSSAPMPSTTAFATSMVSPLPISPASFVSPEAVQMTPSHPASPAQSSASYYTGSPAVEQVVTTVSTETASLAALTTATATATSSIMPTSGIDGTLGLPLSDHDNSILLGFGADDSPHLNGDNSLLFAKYSEGLGDQANEFYLDANDSTEDVFFGRS